MSDETRPVPEQDPETGRFVAGNSGNGGRAKGSRNKLGEAFIADLYADWQDHGKEAVAKVRAEKPDAYLKVVASILPREIKVTTEQDLDDAELDRRIRQLAAALSLEIGDPEGIGVAAGREEAASRH
jgi:hypothetical protein